MECFEIQAISIHISEKVLPLMGSLRALGAGYFFLQLYLLHFLQRSLKVKVLNS